MEIPSIWLERLGAWRSSGLSAKVFCEGKDFSVHSLRSWRARQLAAERRAAPRKPAMAMARVQVAAPRVRGSSEHQRATGISIEVGAVRVSVGLGFDRATLATVLAVIVPSPASESER